MQITFFLFIKQVQVICGLVLPLVYCVIIGKQMTSIVFQN